MLFDIDKEGNLFSQDARIALVPELQALYKAKGYGARYLRWVALVYDNESPYRRRPLEQRKVTVAKECFGSKSVSSLDEPIINNAVKAYCDLQYDPLAEQLQLLLEQVEKFNNMLRKQDPNQVEDWDERKKYLETLIKLQELQDTVMNAKRRYNEELEKKSGRIRGGGKKTYLEMNIERIARNGQTEEALS